MVSDLLRQVQESEENAFKIIEEAKVKAGDITTKTESDIAGEKTARLEEFNQEAARRRQTVKEEEEGKDREFESKVDEELVQIENAAYRMKDEIVSRLSEKIYA